MSRITLLATGDRLVGSRARSFDAVIRELMLEARREIQLVTYRFDRSALPLLDLLEQAAARGVSVLIAVSDIPAQPPEIRRRLGEMSRRPRIRVVDCRQKTGSLVHAKVLVADRERAIIGSANLTWGGLVDNHEIGVLIEGEEAWDIARMVDALSRP